ncbi:hypothetical protein JOL79_00015 [Microbispora sp. RL4-1S]|uniref:Uncharacterized protein n=1 Tax=Microbispora oryzae TaxID=2806554 RepID=A0A940WB08_9ACTN|nr:hypothetical protein [Microbispora oryzae]MBP2702181.1 hypothetical protein [Microbispora oryzae]
MGALFLALTSVITFVFRDLKVFTRTFDEVVAPLVDKAVNPGERQHVREALRATSLKVGFLLSMYAMMVRKPGRPDLFVLGGAIARLYDDLMDHSDRPDLDGGLDALFSGGPFTPLTEFDVLLHELHQSLALRLDLPEDALPHVTLRALHGYQKSSHQQKDPAIREGLLWEITRGKGATANLLLHALVHPYMTAREQDVLKDLGVTLQVLDDYFDRDIDRAAGITTPATRGGSRLPDVRRRLRTTRAALHDLYSRPGSRPYTGALYAMLAWAYLSRLPHPRRPARRSSARTPLLVFARRGNGVINLSPHESGPRCAD